MTERVLSTSSRPVGFQRPRSIYGAGDISFELVSTVEVAAATAAAGDSIMLANQDLEYRFFIFSDLFRKVLT